MSTGTWVLRYVYILAVVLVPLVPAYVLFRVLRSTASVKGPYQGLTINLGGAGALYFVIFITLFLALKPWSRLQADREAWTIKGKVGLDSVVPTDHDITIRLKPPEKLVAKGDSVPFVFGDATPSENGDISLVFESNGFQPEGRCLVPGEPGGGVYQCDSDNRIITISEPIVLRRLPSDEQPYRFVSQ